MARKYVISIDLNKNELLNARIQNLSSAPSSPAAGQIYFDTTTHVLYFYNGSAWIPASGSTEVIQDLIGSSVIGGTGITATYDDTAGTTTLDIDSTVVTLDGTQTLTNKTIGDALTFNDGSNNSTIDVTGNNLEIDANGDLLLTTGNGDIILNPDGSSYIGSAVTGNRISTQSYAQTQAGNAQTAAEGYTDTAVGTHNTATTGVHGVSGDVVGTSDTQTLTNKTLGSGTSLDSALDANGKKITSLADPVDPQDAANKRYVDNAVSGLDWKTSVNLLATSNVDISGDLVGTVIDGHGAFDTNDGGYRILLTAQSTDSQNGIYVLTVDGSTLVASRPADADAYTELVGAAIFVMEGTQYGSTSWVQSNHYLSDFTNQEWVQFSGAGTYTAGDGISLVGNEFTVHLDSDSLVKSGSGLKVNYHTESGLDNDSGLYVKLGTGLVFDGSGNITNNTNAGYGVRKYAQQIGDGATTSIYVEHGLGTRSVTVQVFETGTPYAQVEADVEHTDTDGVTIKFAVAPASSEYEVVVIG